METTEMIDAYILYTDIEAILIQEELKNIGIKSWLQEKTGKIGKHLKDANHKEATVCIFYLEDEVREGKVTVKLMHNGKQASLNRNNFIPEFKEFVKDVMFFQDCIRCGKFVTGEDGKGKMMRWMYGKFVM